MFGWYQNCFYLCTRFSEVKYSGCSAVRLAHLLWEQGVVGSNPATPTGDKAKYLIFKCLAFVFSIIAQRICGFVQQRKGKRKNSKQ